MMLKNHNTILVIEDDPIQINIIKNTLERDYKLVFSTDVLNAEVLILKNKPFLILSDITLNDGNAVDYFQKSEILKSSKLPIFFISTDHAIRTKLEAYGLGAWDFIEKPFDPLELLAKVQSLYSRRIDTSSSIVELETIRVDLNTCKVFIDGDEIELTAKEYKLFLIFVNNPEIVFNRSQLLEMLYHEDIAITERTIDQLISRLRKKAKSSKWCINTIRELGYIFQKN